MEACRVAGFSHRIEATLDQEIYLIPNYIHSFVHSTNLDYLSQVGHCAKHGLLRPETDVSSTNHREQRGSGVGQFVDMVMAERKSLPYKAWPSTERKV